MRKGKYFKKLFFVVVFLIIFTGGFVLYAHKAFLYSGTPTHYGLSQEMIKLYNLTYDPDLTPRQTELILKGTLDEDILPRPVFHLYDPVYNRSPAKFLGIDFVYTAKQWALTSESQESILVKFGFILFNVFKTGFKYHGDYSWPASVNYFANNDIDKAYYGLGHILHLIEDMTVPAHSRNDPHAGGDPYEIWGENSTKPENYNWAENLYQRGKKPALVYAVGQAFDELAGYSNKYFFSQDSILNKDYNSPKILKEQQEDFGRYLQRVYALGKDENGILFRLAYKDYEASNWRKLSPDEVDRVTVYNIDKDDLRLNTDYWNRLAPKAVIYGAGVIKLFLQENGIAVKSDYVARQPILRFPIAKDVVPPTPPSPPAEITQKPAQPQSGEVKGEATEKQESQDGSITVTGPKTGGEGGMSWQEAQNMSQPASISEEIPMGGGEASTSEEPELPEPPAPPEIPPHLIINEIQIKDNEFVELYNPTSASLNLASYSFCYYSANREWNDPYRNKQFSEAASISAGGYYLIGLKGYTQENGNPDADWQVYDSVQLSNEAGSIVIFPWDLQEKTVSEAEEGAIDAVAWGEVGNVSEGISFQEILGQDKSMQRKAFQDTNENNSDFEFKKIPSPTNSNGEQRKPGTTIYDHTLISEDTIWTIAGSPYYIEMNAGEWPRVAEGVTLIIEPGVVIMPMGANITFFEIRGTLLAEGTDTEKIIFTSIKDTDYGGVGSASAGDWMNMIFTPTSKNSSFKNVIFRYGGDDGGLMGYNPAMIKVDSSSIKMENVVMENSEYFGLHLINSNSEIKGSTFKDSATGIMIEGDSSSPTIDGCTFENNSEYGLYIWQGAVSVISNNNFINNGTVGMQGPVIVYSAYPDFINNQASNNSTNGILIHWQSRFEKDTVWKADLPYVPIATPVIASGSTLTLDPGVVIKPFSGRDLPALMVLGTLLAQAASGSEIVITSLKDDNFGGDTNNDNDLTSPNNSDWSYVEFSASSYGSILDHVFIYYGVTPPIKIDPSAEVEIRDTVDFVP